MIQKILGGICIFTLAAFFPIIVLLQSMHLFPWLEGPAELAAYCIVLLAIVITLIMSMRALSRRTVP